MMTDFLGISVDNNVDCDENADACRVTPILLELVSAFLRFHIFSCEVILGERTDILGIVQPSIANPTRA
jgi:hypothetical protein